MEHQPESSIVHDLERKLNPKSWRLRHRERDAYCRLSVAYYWDWIPFVDDDYLTEWEVLRMKELVVQQHAFLLQ